MLHFDVELQNDYHPSNPSYPLIKRAVYNAARMLSRQLGTITEETNYNYLEKVYSIWICNDRIPRKLQNTMTGYSIERRDLIGHVTEEPSLYDLLSVVMVRRGEETGDADIFRYLQAVFSGDLEGVDRYIPVRENEKIRKELSGMLTYDMTVARRNYVKGFREGEEKGLKVGEAQGFKDGEAQGFKNGEAQGFKNGEVQGEERAETKMQKLIHTLFDHGDQAAMKKVMTASREELHRMYQQYGIS